MLNNEHVYGIPIGILQILVMKRLFESRKVLAAGTVIPAPDAKIIFTKAPFTQYEQILVDNKF